MATKKKSQSSDAIDIQAPARPYGEGLTKTLSFRVPIVLHDHFEKRCQESGWSKADLFRATFIGTETKINYKPVNPRSLPDYRGAAFQIRKAGNNINQVAHALNRAARYSQIDERLAAAALVQLNAIYRAFVLAIEEDEGEEK